MLKKNQGKRPNRSFIVSLATWPDKVKKTALFKAKEWALASLDQEVSGQYNRS
jgi:hypothetical protein